MTTYGATTAKFCPATARSLPWYVPTSACTTPMTSPPITAPRTESRPPRMMAGSAISATIQVCWSMPAPVPTKTPATAASAPAIAHERANTVPTEIPCASATSWSSAVARIASPIREYRKNANSAATRTAVVTIIARYRVSTATPSRS